MQSGNTNIYEASGIKLGQRSADIDVCELLMDEWSSDIENCSISIINK